MQEVWEDYARPWRWSSWSPQIRGVEVPADRIAPGLRGVVRGPLGLRVRFVVTAADERGRTWRWVVSVAGTTVALQHAVVGVPGGSMTSLVLEGPALVRVLYPALARRALRRLVGSRP